MESRHGLSLSAKVLWCISSTSVLIVGASVPMIAKAAGASNTIGVSVPIVIQTPSGDSFDLEKVSCSDANYCVAIGSGGSNAVDTNGVNNGPSWVDYAIETNGVWGPVTPITASYYYDDSSVNAYWLFSISCGAINHCTAVGYNENSQAIYVNEVDGVWGPATAVLGAEATGELLSVSCFDANDCTAVGEAGSTNGYSYDIYAVETDGVWAPYTSFPGPVSTVSCGDATHCTATNGPYYSSESNGVWGPVTYTGSGSPYGESDNVSCSEADNCTISTGAGFISEVDGIWGPFTALNTGGLLSCTNAEDCIVIDGETYQIENNGVWGAVNFLPGDGSNVSTNKIQSVSCTKDGFCTAIGSQINQSQPDQILSYSINLGSQRYIALGDSFSSGEGAVVHIKIVTSPNPDFLPGTDVWTSKSSTNICHRSLYAYPELVAKSLSLELNFAACSGAVIKDLSSTGQWGEPNQLSKLGTSPDPSIALVTLSIGGNDAQFSTIMKSCISGVYSPDYSSTICSKSGISVRVVQGIQKLGSESANAPGLSLLIQKIRSLAPDAKILIVGYPHLFASSLATSCPVLSLSGLKWTVSASATRWINEGVDRINAELKLIVQEQKDNSVLFIDPTAAFSSGGDHSLCGHGVQWLNRTYVTSSPDPRNWSFHPNVLGQAEYASLIQTAYNN